MNMETPKNSRISRMDKKISDITSDFIERQHKLDSEMVNSHYDGISRERNGNDWSDESKIFRVDEKNPNRWRILTDYLTQHPDRIEAHLTAADNCLNNLSKMRGDVDELKEAEVMKDFLIKMKENLNN